MTRADDIAGEEEGDVSTLKPGSSRPWLALLTKARKAGYDDYNDRCDKIDKLFASLERLASNTRDREMQVFWANIQVLGPSIYARPPVPVVMPRFKDRRPLYRIAADLIERATTVLFDMEDIDGVMRQVRDDLILSARGVIWLRYDAKEKGSSLDERVCIEHVDRKDFLHDPARKWKEVDWVAKGSWLTRAEMRKRFRRTSADAYKNAAFSKKRDGDDQKNDGTLKARVWEIWSKSSERVVWVTEGVDVVLDDAEPHLELEGFFPCPRPVYATTQRRSMIPVPDFVYYKDQVEEINELTARIGALTESLRLKGFYPAGASDIADAIETAIQKQTNRQVLVGVANWAAMGNGSANDLIVWLPLDMVAKVITSCLDQRRQLIDDVYQVTGLSDIMRGATQASETLGAQQLKSQYGSIRIRDRQDDLVRIARDTTRIAAEIMAENFDGDTLLDMTQLQVKRKSEVDAEAKPVKAELAGLQRQIEAAQRDPQIAAMMQADPEKAQQALGEVQKRGAPLIQKLQQIEAQVTIEDVMKALRDQRIRPYTLDIETDSTVVPDENAAKQRASEGLRAIGEFLGQSLPLLQQDPSSAPMVSDLLKYVAGQFRMGREVETSIDEYADSMKQKAANPQPNPAQQAEQQAAQAKAQETAAKMQMDQQRGQQELALKDLDIKAREQDIAGRQALIGAELEAKRAEAEARMREIDARNGMQAEKHAQDMEKGGLEIERLMRDIERASVVAAEKVAQVQSPQVGGA